MNGKTYFPRTDIRRVLKIYELRTKNKMSCGKIGKELSLSLERVRQILKIETEIREKKKYWNNEVNKAKTKKQVLSLPVGVLELNVRMINTLNRLEIKTISDLTKCSESKLINTRNFGIKSFKWLNKKLQTLSSAKGMDLKIKQP